MTVGKGNSSGVYIIYIYKIEGKKRIIPMSRKTTPDSCALVFFLPRRTVATYGAKNDTTLFLGWEFWADTINHPVFRLFSYTEVIIFPASGGESISILTLWKKKIFQRRWQSRRDRCTVIFYLYPKYWFSENFG